VCVRACVRMGGRVCVRACVYVNAACMHACVRACVHEYKTWHGVPSATSSNLPAAPTDRNAEDQLSGVRMDVSSHEHACTREPRKRVPIMCLQRVEGRACMRACVRNAVHATMRACTGALPALTRKAAVRWPARWWSCRCLVARRTAGVAAAGRREVEGAVRSRRSPRLRRAAAVCAHTSAQVIHTPAASQSLQQRPLTLADSRALVRVSTTCVWKQTSDTVRGLYFSVHGWEDTMAAGWLLGDAGVALFRLGETQDCSFRRARAATTPAKWRGGRGKVNSVSLSSSHPITCSPACWFAAGWAGWPAARATPVCCPPARGPNSLKARRS